MARTRSGMLDKFDPTGIEDSGGDDNIAAVRRRQRGTRKRAVAEAARNKRGSISATATPSPTSASRDKHAITQFTRGEKKNETGIGTVTVTTSSNSLMPGTSICRPISPSEACNHYSDKNNEDEDIIEIIDQSNLGNNPLVDFPHRREDCRRFDFLNSPERFCRLCYCYICDVPASKCSEWYVSPTSKESHCLAKHSDKKSQLRRKSVQMRKNTLRPRKQIMPPLRHRSIRKSSQSGKTNRSAKYTLRGNEKFSSNRSVMRPAVSRNRNTSKGTKVSIPKIPPLRSMRSLRPRNMIQMPIRLRRSAGMISDSTNRKKSKKKRSLSSLSSPIPNLSHDLFLPGKKTQPSLPSDTTTTGKTTTPNQEGTESFRAGKVTPSPNTAGKRKRRPDSTLRKRITRLRSLCADSSLDKQVSSRRKSPSNRRKRAQRTKVSKPTTSRNTVLSPNTSQSTRKTRSPTQRKTKTTPIRSSNHFTRSCGKTNPNQTPEIFGSLGAYWRGEPTKYAGVPYQKLTSSTGSSESQLLQSEDTVSKREGRRLRASTRKRICTTGSRIKRQQRMLPMSSGCVREEEAMPTMGNDAPGKQGVTATLEGTISYDFDSQRYSILGTWHCPLSESFPPQKFGLVRNLREGERVPTANRSTLNGSFDGYCVVTSRSFGDMGKPKYHDRLVFERDVVLEFSSNLGTSNTDKPKSRKSKPLKVHGFGSNKFGSFHVEGMAHPCPRVNNVDGKNLYTVILQKRYLRKSSICNDQTAANTRKQPRATRSNSIYGKGTIIRKLFDDGEHYEGEVISYDPIFKYYKIKYNNGDEEEFDDGEMKKYYKHLQRYSKAPYAAKILGPHNMLVNSSIANDSYLTRVE